MKSLKRRITQLRAVVRKGKTFRVKHTRVKLGIFAVSLLAAVYLSPIARSIPPGKIAGSVFWEQPSITLISQGKAADDIRAIEQKWETEYENYFGGNLADRSMTTDQMAIKLLQIAIQTGKKPAVIWEIPQREQLRLMLLTPGSKAVAKNIPDASRENLLKVVRRLRRAVASPRSINTQAYLAPAQQLYQWMIAPIASRLADENIDTLLFCVGGGLRSVPLAVLHDGENFIVEKYSISLIPAFNLIETDYGQIQNSPVLAMGASEFTNLNPLPAVPVELETIAKKLWQGKLFLNQAFTLENLKAELETETYKIVHLATHAEFKSGAPDQSYIQFWDSKLRLDQIGDLDWNNPPIELLVLSACRTALGDKDAELGFAGLALQAGVKSALASLWYVSDAGTLGLMTEFYQHLRRQPIKAEALRQAQVAMLEGDVRLLQGELRGEGTGVSLPPALAKLGNENLSHPYYWAAFTMISSPW